MIEHTTTRTAAIMAVLLTMLLFASGCGSETGGSAPENGGGGQMDETPSRQEQRQAEREATADRVGDTTVGETTAEEPDNPLAGAELGPNEESNMAPAGGAEPDPARPLPDDPPEGVRLYPATTNETVEGPVEYPRQPPTNGDHDPLWQNCGFYEQPVQDRHAVHSMDHGAVWISYRPDLPAEQIAALREYGTERYVLVSPYPGQEAPVVATAWRLQLKLDGPDDPRLREFVDAFRVTELAPLSGNGCTGGVGDPDSSG